MQHFHCRCPLCQAKVPFDDTAGELPDDRAARVVRRLRKRAARPKRKTRFPNHRPNGHNGQADSGPKKEKPA